MTDFPLSWPKLPRPAAGGGLTGKVLWFLAMAAFAPFAHSQVTAKAPAPNRPLNVILILRDQTRYDLPAAAGYNMPALERLAQRGFTFRNHYVASAMCTPSRAALWSGQPPQVNGVFDQMEAGYVPSLRTDRPNMGSMMKKLGYQTAFFGKWEMQASIIPPKPTVNYSEALQPYGFEIFQPDGDKTGAPDQGYKTDVYTASESVRWLRGNLPRLRAVWPTVLPGREFRQSARHHVCGCQCAGNGPVTKGRRERRAHLAAKKFAVPHAMESRSLSDDAGIAVGPGNARGADRLPPRLVGVPRLHSGESHGYVAGV